VGVAMMGVRTLLGGVVEKEGTAQRKNCMGVRVPYVSSIC
jgi:hypothetical protein